MSFSLLFVIAAMLQPLHENTDSTYFILQEGENVEMIVSPKGLEGDYYFSDFLDYPLLIKDDRCLVLDSPDLQVKKLPFSGSYSEVQWTNDTIYYSKGYEVRQFCAGKDEPIFKAECDSIMIALSHDVGLFFTQETSLCFFRFRDRSFHPLYDFDIQINDMSADALLCYVASGNAIYLAGDKVYEILACEEPITSVAPISDDSLFFGTDSGLFRYTYPDDCFCVVDKGVKRIRKIYDAVYVVFNDDSAYRVILPTSDKY